MTNTKTWKPTHRVYWTLRRPDDMQVEPIKTEVMLDADAEGYGPAYTRIEWNTCNNAYHEKTENGWLFAGRTTPGGINGDVWVKVL